MKLIPTFLRLNYFKIHKESFDGNRPVAEGTFKGKNGDYLDFTFQNPTAVNLITLFENGNNVTDFEIYYEQNGEFIRIYRQNRIADFRVCAIGEIKTKKIRIKVCNTRKGFFKEIQAFIYHLPKKATSFRRTAYVVTDILEQIDPANLKHYNKFNIIGGIETDGEGKVCFKNGKFHDALSLVRDYDPNADIVVTLLPRGDILKVLKNPETPRNIKAFLDEYNLNGVSFDWEFPKNLYEWRVFDKFIIRLKEAIKEKSVTLALPSWLPYHFSQKALDCIDVAEVMTYDNMPRDIDGHHSEFFSDGPNAIYHFVRKGFKLSQLDLGLPYYARPVDGAAYWSDYSAEVDKMDRFTNVVEDEYRDFDVNKKEITVKPRFYNSCQMIEDKTAFCVYAGVGGIMIWALNADTPESHPLCLSKVLEKVIEERTK